jgi:hypothetical protein
MRSRLFVPILASLLIPAVFGCGSSGPREYEVTGTVTFDDQPVADGYITFLPEEKEFGPDAGKIVDGKYRAKVKPGNKRVVIQASRPVPGKKGPMGEQEIEAYIPARYSDREKTELRAEVGEGKTEHSFTLKPK